MKDELLSGCIWWETKCSQPHQTEKRKEKHGHLNTQQPSKTLKTDGQMVHRFSVGFCTEYAKWRKKSFIVSHILPLSLHIFSSGIFAKPINHAFLPDCGAFLYLRPSGVPTHTPADTSHGRPFDRESTQLFGFWRFYLDICNTDSTMER